MRCCNTKAAKPRRSSRPALRVVPRREVATFFRERLEFYLRDVKGYAYDVVNAVLASGADNVPDAIMRAEAVARVRGSEDFEAISSAFKRTQEYLAAGLRKQDMLIGEPGILADG